MTSQHSELPPHRLWQPTTAKWFVAISGTSLLYAVVRYHIAGDVPWAHLPLFILNKATSLAAIGFLACSYLLGKVIHCHDHDPRLRLVVIKFCGLVGFFLAGAHALMSFRSLTQPFTWRSSARRIPWVDCAGCGYSSLISLSAETGRP